MAKKKAKKKKKVAKKKAKKKATKKKAKKKKAKKKRKRQRNNLVKSPLVFGVIGFQRAAGQSRLVERGPICSPAPIKLRLTPNWCGKNGNPAATGNIETAASYAKMEGFLAMTEPSIFIYARDPE